MMYAPAWAEIGWVQTQLINLLQGNVGCITVVGDDAQSIYAFRGTSPSDPVSIMVASQCCIAIIYGPAHLTFAAYSVYAAYTEYAAMHYTLKSLSGPSNAGCSCHVSAVSCSAATQRRQPA